MIWFRRGVVFLLSLLLLTSLILTVVSIDANRQLGNPAKLEGWLAGSGIYDQVPSAMLEQAQKNQTNDGTGSISLNDPVVQQAAATAFSSGLVQQSVNSFLNGNYDWLAGKKAAPDFNVDLSGAKQSFAQQIGQATQQHLAGLPVCSPTQLTQLPIPADPLTIKCRPSTLDPKAEGDRVAQEVNSSNDLLPNAVITPESLGGKQGEPYYKRMAWLPTAYKVGVKLPLIAVGLALLTGLGIIFISSTRRRGLRRVGFVSLLAGLILIGLKFFADSSAHKLAGSVSASLGSELKKPISDLVRQLEPQLVSHYLLFGGFLVLVAVIVFVSLIASRQRDSRPKVPAAPQPVPEDQTASADSVRLAPRRPAPSYPAPTPKPSAPQLRPTVPKPLGKNPPKRRPPKLIQ